jgi:hypothetical protein
MSKNRVGGRGPLGRCGRFADHACRWHEIPKPRAEGRIDNVKSNCTLDNSAYYATRRRRDAVGNWNFNADQSDDAQRKVQEAQQNSQRGSAGGGYPGGGSAGGGYPGGGGMGAQAFYSSPAAVGNLGKPRQLSNLFLTVPDSLYCVITAIKRMRSDGRS